MTWCKATLQAVMLISFRASGGEILKSIQNELMELLKYARARAGLKKVFKADYYYKKAGSYSNGDLYTGS